MPALRRISFKLLCGVFFLLAALAAPASAAELTLHDEVLAQTADGRELLKYLVSCALPEGTTAVASAGSERFSFAGKMGLAPAWSARGMTEHEERLVSACLIARTNHFGVTVQISMRNDASNAPASLQTDAREKAQFPFFEGSFFGNLFKEKPEAYVCTGNPAKERHRHLTQLQRVCTLPRINSDSPRSASVCNFVIVGNCHDQPFVQNGVDYAAERISVYLPFAQ